MVTKAETKTNIKRCLSCSGYIERECKCHERKEICKGECVRWNGRCCQMVKRILNS